MRATQPASAPSSSSLLAYSPVFQQSMLLKTPPPPRCERQETPNPDPADPKHETRNPKHETLKPESV
ncbi:hypothetical protein T484DRAFT_1950947 [Baffinella frigidus]|nr:hypothetical protein T484DRAFT_1950947 [Cryptophyta sp. CCMP2293]